MNKFSATLVGLAIVAGASVAPAFAGGTFSTDPVTPPIGTFSTSGTGYSFFTEDAFYNGTIAGSLELTGFNEDAKGHYTTSLVFVSTAPGLFSVSETGAISGLDSFGAVPTLTDFEIHDLKGFASGDRFSVGPLAPVPEASTVVSFGALLALGGLAFLRRKTAQTAA